jgi:hypothetical protein
MAPSVVAVALIAVANPNPNPNPVPVTVPAEPPLLPLPPHHRTPARR